MAKQLTDAILIKMILRGESDQFEILVRKYSQRLYKIARSYNYNHDEAEDLMEKTFVNAYKNLNHLHEKRRFKTFLTGMMLHECTSGKKIDLPIKSVVFTALSADFLSKILTGFILIPCEQFYLFA